MGSMTNISETNIKEKATLDVYQDPAQAENKEQEEVVILVRHVSKKFCLNSQCIWRMGLLNLSKNLLGLKLNSSTLRQGAFWALR
jgi:hypothetical protein